MEDVRIHKFLADAGIMSRRAAEEAVKQGKIRINGEIATLGQKLDPEADVVEYNGKVVKATKKRCEYYILNKPVGYVTTLSDEKGRPCISDLITDIQTRV
jgi:23S rRNA pseudouridine2605 synthase